LTGTTTTPPTSGQCGPKPQTSAPLAGEQGRCGFGPRQPLLVVSPFAVQNHVDHNISDLASIPNLIEYNWRLPSIDGSADQVLQRADRSEGVRFDLAGLFRFGGDRRGGFHGFGDGGGKLFLDPSTGQPVGGGRSFGHRHTPR
jgi:phospholipase C